MISESIINVVLICGVFAIIGVIAYAVREEHRR